MQIQLLGLSHFQKYRNQEEWPINYLYCQGSHLGDLEQKEYSLAEKKMDGA